MGICGNLGSATNAKLGVPWICINWSGWSATVPKDALALFSRVVRGLSTRVFRSSASHHLLTTQPSAARTETTGAFKLKGPLSVYGSVHTYNI